MKVTLNNLKIEGLVTVSNPVYTPLSVTFDGTNDYLTAGALTGAEDGINNLTSIWFKVDDAGGDGNLMVFSQNSTSSYSVTRNASDKIEINLENSASTVLWNFTSTESYNSTTNTGWHNLLFSVELDGSPTASVYVDNEVLAGTDNTGPIAGDIDYTVADWAIGGTTAGANKLTGELSDFYMTDEFLDITLLASRVKFINTTGGISPEFLGDNGSIPTGNIPLMFFTGGSGGSIDNWEDNEGTGDGFTENGALTSGSAPSIPEEEEVTVNFTEGSLFTWGYSSNYGLLGDGTVSINASSPVQIGALTNWTFGTGGRKHSLAIRADNTLWVWGSGVAGVLGNNANGIAASRSSPVQVPGANWADASGGEGFSLGVKTDGTLWGWGDGNSGRTGHGNTTDYSIPVQIGGAANWASVVAGPFHGSALTTGGALWMWGSNAYGELGQGDTTYRSVPVQVAGSDWAVISTGQFRQVAIKTNGTLWSWGLDSYRGNLGHGTVNTDLNYPAQVGSDTNWSSVVANEHHSTLALKTDGTLWGWGYNKFSTGGILGVGDADNHSSPVQIGSLTDWAKIGISNTTGVAIKTDGTLWTWGGGYSGGLGDGTAVYRSSPVQVGLDANWAFVGRTSGDFSGRNIVIRDTNG